MARCECGALYVPSGKDVTVTFKQGGLSTSMQLDHSSDALVFDGQELLSYGDVPSSPSVSPTLISISFDNAANLKVVGLFKIVVRTENITLTEKYIGTKNNEYIIPLINNKPTITASCSDIVNNIDISNTRIYVDFVSVCDSSPEDCCGNTVDFNLRNVVDIWFSVLPY